MNDSVIFDLYLSREQFLQFYQGLAHEVSATGQDGRQIRFPAHYLRDFVTPEGINGTFELTFDGQRKFKSLVQLA